MPPKKQKTSVEDQIHLEQLCASFIQEKWELIKDVQILKEAKPAVFNSPKNGNNLINIFKELFDTELQDLLRSIINRNLAVFSNFNKKSRSDQRMVLNNDELVNFYGTFMLIENTYGNKSRNLRHHFKLVKEEFGAIKGMGYDRFQTLMAALQPDLDEFLQISDLIKIRFQKLISQVSVITEDELLIGYQSSKQVKERSETIGEPIPIVYMPRKPHPIGLLNYLLVTYVDDPIKIGKKRPYILDLQPHIQSGDTSLIEITSNFLNRWTLPDRPHFIGDSAFGSLDAIQAIADWGGRSTFAMKEIVQSELWAILSFNCIPETFRLAYNRDLKIVASCRTIVPDGSNQSHHQNVFSTSFFPLGNTSQSADIPIAVDISPNQVLPDLSQSISPDRSTRSENSPNQEGEIGISTPTDNSIQRRIPIFIMGDLKNLQVKDLKLIMKKYNIKINRKKKNKQDLIEKILQRSNIVNQGQSEVKSLVDQLPKNYQIGKSPINSFYGDSFNFIDMISKRWNFTEEHHLHRSWKT